MAKALFDLHTGGKLPDQIYRLSSLTRMRIDSEHGTAKFFQDIAAAAQKLSRTDPAQTRFLLQGAGINDATANAMIKYGSGLTGVAIDLAPTDKAIKAAQDLAASFSGAQELVRSVGSAVAEQLDEPLAKMLDALSGLIEANKQVMASSIVDGVKAIATGLETFAKFAKQGLDTLGRAEDFLDRTAPPSLLHPLTPPNRWSEWWKSGGDFLKSGEDFLKRHDPFDIGAHADELPPVAGQQVSRGNPLPVDVVRVAGQGADANSFLGGPIGSGGAPPSGAGLGSGHGSSDGVRARGTPGGGGSGPNVTPQPDDTVQSLAAKYRDRYPHLSSQQCVALAMAAADIGGTVRDWRKGDSVKDSAIEPGAPIATFLNPDGTPSDRYAGGGIGTPGANRDHAAIFLGKTKDGAWVEEQYSGSGGPHAHFYPWKDPRGGEKSAENYFAINDSHGLPAGTHNPHRGALHLPAHPHTLTPLPKTSALIPSGGAKMALAGYPVASSKSTTRNIGRLAVKGNSAQEIADHLVAGIRAELTA